MKPWTLTVSLARNYMHTPPPTQKCDALIWWINQGDCETIGTARWDWPAYLRRQYDARLGRPGRCRLWVDAEVENVLGLVAVDPWPDNPLSQLLVASDCGGIAIRPEDLAHLLKMPGVVTDTTLTLVHEEDT